MKKTEKHHDIIVTTVADKIQQWMLKKMGEGLRKPRVWLPNIFFKYLFILVVEYVHKFLNTSPSRKGTLIFLFLNVGWM